MSTEDILEVGLPLNGISPPPYEEQQCNSKVISQILSRMSALEKRNAELEDCIKKIIGTRIGDDVKDTERDIDLNEVNLAILDGRTSNADTKSTEFEYHIQANLDYTYREFKRIDENFKTIDQNFKTIDKDIEKHLDRIDKNTKLLSQHIEKQLDRIDENMKLVSEHKPLIITQRSKIGVKLD